MKSLVIVGSAPLQKNFSNLIDSFDCVVRFNNCKNYGGNSGYKTDILFLNNCGNPDRQRTIKFLLKQRTEKEVLQELPYISNASEVCFVRPSSSSMMDFFQRRFSDSNFFKKSELEKNSHKRDLASEIAKALYIPDEIVRKISDDTFESLWDKLLKKGDTDAIMPSTGMIGIDIILNDERLNKFKKYIVGFNWQGWEGHPWKLEEELINEYIDQGLLIPLKPAVTFKSTITAFKKLFRK